MVEFTLGPEDFGFYDADGKFVIEPGEHQIMVGGDSENLKTSTITLT
jgi:beta-glucosidase